VIITTVVAALALGIACGALALAITVMRQSAETTTDLRRHRRAHTEAHGHPDPKLDRRQANHAPPRTTGERRGATRYEPPAERPAPPLITVDEPLTREQADAILDEPPPGMMPARYDMPEPDTDPGPGLPATGELEQPDLPTALIPRQPPPEQQP